MDFRRNRKPTHRLPGDAGGLRERGHPRLRMRHHPYTIDPEARDHWLACMRVALSARNLSAEDDAELWTYLVSSAFAMVNTMDLPEA